MKKRWYVIFTLATACWLLTACSDDAPQQDDTEDTFIELRAMTRAGDDAGDEDYKHDIQAFLIDGDGNAASGKFIYHHEDAVDETPARDYWTAYQLKVKPGTRAYWLYGFMPADGVLEGSMDYTNKKLTINHITPLTTQDIYVVTGVERNKDVQKPARGNFEFNYVNSEFNQRTYLNLLLDHLFGRFEFKFIIGSRYSELRQIKLKEVRIEGTAKAEISAAVNLNSEDAGFGKPTYTVSGAAKTWKILDNTTGNEIPLWTGEAWLTTTAPETDNHGCINVAVGDGLTNTYDYELICTYEVWDQANAITGKTDKLLSTRTARNKLSGVLPEVGQKKTLELIIEPTYLYQLSDDDLNNPTVKIN